MIVKVELEEDDYGQLSESIFNATDKDLGMDQLKKIWDEHLPDDIKESAIHWGLSDTPVRDSIYEWAEQNVTAIFFME